MFVRTDGLMLPSQLTGPQWQGKSPKQPWANAPLALLLSESAGVVPLLSARGSYVPGRGLLLVTRSNPLTQRPSPCQMKKLARRQQQQQQDQQNTQRLSSGKWDPPARPARVQASPTSWLLVDGGRPLLGSAKPCLHQERWSSSEDRGPGAGGEGRRHEPRPGMLTAVV